MSNTSDSKMTKRYRLLARAQLDGEVREPGYVFTLAEGERGPFKTVVASNDGAAASEALDDSTPRMRDEPLYEPVTD
jgi:hypothetical protein